MIRNIILRKIKILNHAQIVNNIELSDIVCFFSFYGISLSDTIDFSCKSALFDSPE